MYFYVVYYSLKEKKSPARSSRVNLNTAYPGVSFRNKYQVRYYIKKNVPEAANKKSATNVKADV
jgi:hypothetical protein